MTRFASLHQPYCADCKHSRPVPQPFYSYDNFGGADPQTTLKDTCVQQDDEYAAMRATIQERGTARMVLLPSFSSDGPALPSRRPPSSRLR